MIAKVQCSDGQWRIATLRKRWIDDSSVWVFEDGLLRDTAESVSRPLVVIDPEDSEAADALCKLLVEAMYAAGDERSAANGVHPATVAAALRQLANPTPPKVEEPLGLGAVVEDEGGRKWVRTEYKYPWTVVYGDDCGESLNYADIAAVRVLSPGYTEAAS